MPSDALVLEVLLGPHDEEGIPLVDLEEFLEGIVAAIEHVIRTRLVGNLAHHLGIVDRGLRDMEERWNGSLQIVKEMNLYTTFPFSELGPPEDRQAQRYRCRVERIDLPFSLKMSTTRLLRAWAIM